MELQFESDFIESLNEFSIIQKQISELEERRSALRKKFDKWMKINSFDYHEQRDKFDKLWQLAYATRKSSKPNWEFIYDMIPEEEHKNVRIQSESDPYITIREIKKSKLDQR